jgi:peptidoglycan biosynthesis protein MviN/MurJ (putative lipid II flippase)
VLADAICQPLWRVIYALRQTWTVVTVNGLQTVVRVFGNIVLIRYFGYNGIALSAVLGLSLQAVVLGLLVQRQLDFPSKFSGWREVGVVAFASAIAAGVAYFSNEKFNLGGPVITLLVSGVIGLFTYVLVLLCLKYLKKKKTQNPNPV